MRFLRIAAAIALATVATACDDEDLVTFRVEIENISPNALVGGDRAEGTMPLSAGVYAVYDGSNPIFDPDANATRGLELLAEEGIPSAEFAPVEVTTDLLTEVQADEDVTIVDVFTSPGGPDDGPGLFAGERTVFEFQAEEGEDLQIVTMLVQSNDLFLAFDGDGLDLFGTFGDPIDGVVTDELVVYDAGTEVDEDLGLGENQPLNTPGVIDVGDAENAEIEEGEFVVDVPDLEDFVRVIITPISETEIEDDDDELIE